MRRLFIGLFVLVIIISYTSSLSAADLNLTINLLSAKPGSWVRSYLPNGHSKTWHVVSVNKEEVALQFIRIQNGALEENYLYTIPTNFILQNGVDPNAPSATSQTLSHNGIQYNVQVVSTQNNLFYISSAIPANGILRIDVNPGNNAVILWTDAFGNSPDALIQNAGPGQMMPLPD